MTMLEPYRPSKDEWDTIIQQSLTIAKSGLAPRDLRSPDAIAVVALKGAEMGIPTMMALNHIHVIQGKPTISAELMRALILRSGHQFRVTKTTDQEVVVQGQRWNERLSGYEEPVTASFTMKQAQDAKLTGKDNWKKFPQAMLLARATAILARAMFADVLMGASYTTEEIAPDTDVDENGMAVSAEVLSVERDNIPDFSGPEAPAPSRATGEERPPASGADSAADSLPDESPTPAQFAKFHATLGEYDVTEDQYRSALNNIYGVQSIKALTKRQLILLIDRLSTPEGMSAFMSKIEVAE